MKFSLLYKNFDDSFIINEGPLAEAMSDTVYDLSIDKAAWEFSRNSDSFNYFMEVIKKPLKNIDDIGICYFTSDDVVRHPLVQKIVKAYDDYEARGKEIAAKKRTDHTGREGRKHDNNH